MSLSYVVDGETELDSELFNPIIRVSNNMRAGVANVLDDGAVGDDNTDDTAAILTTINRAISADSGTVYLPGGRTYLFDPAAVSKIKLASNLRFLGDGESSVLKVKPNAGNYAWMLGPATQGTRVENLLIQGICFDQNVENQEDATDPLGDGINNGQFAIGLWNAKNIAIDFCWFRGCGVNTVVVNGDGYSDTTGISITDSRFTWTPLPNATNPSADERAYDNSSIYLVVDGAVVSRNQFSAEITDGARGACEFHGPNMIYAENTIDGYQTAINLGTLSGDYAGNASWVVADNVGHGLMKPVTVAALSGETTNRIAITDNIFHIDTATHNGRSGWGISIGGDVSLATGAYAELDISHNLIHYEPDARTTDWLGENLVDETSHMYFSGIWVWAIDGADTGRIESNTIVNAPTHGISVGVQGAAVRNLMVGGNILKDCGRMKSWATGTPGYINLCGELTDVWLRDGNVIVDTGSGAAIGSHSYRGAAAHTGLDPTRLRVDEGPIVGSGASFLASWAYAPTEVDRAFVKATIAPGTINSATTYSTTVTMTGAATTDVIHAQPVGGIEDGLFYYAYVSAADTITVKIRNNTGGNIAAASRIWRVRRFRTELDV